MCFFKEQEGIARLPRQQKSSCSFFIPLEDVPPDESKSWVGIRTGTHIDLYFDAVLSRRMSGIFQRAIHPRYLPEAFVAYPIVGRDLFVLLDLPLHYAY